MTRTRAIPLATSRGSRSRPGLAGAIRRSGLRVVGPRVAGDSVWFLTVLLEFFRITQTTQRRVRIAFDKEVMPCVIGMVRSIPQVGAPAANGFVWWAWSA